MSIGWSTDGAPVGPAGGDVGGNYPDALVVARVQGVPVSAVGPTAVGQVLKWTGAELAYAADAVGVDYTATLWVDPAGDAASNGLAPSKPTTLANAAATAAAGSCIVLAAGTYPAVTVSTDSITLQGVASDVSAASATPPVQITGLLTIAGRNCRVIGIDCFGGITDSSGAAGAGTTRVNHCSVVASLTVVAPVAGQALEITACDTANVNVTGVSGGFIMRLRSGCRAAAVQHQGTGTVRCEMYSSSATQLVCSGGGTLESIVYQSRLTATPSINVSAGTAGRTTLVDVVCGDDGTTPGFGALVLTGAAVDTVRILRTAYSRLTSTIPVGSIVVARGSAPEQNTVVSTVTTSNPPGSALTYASLPAAGPAYTLDAFSIYKFTGSFTLLVTANNAAYWVDLFINGLGSAIGALEAPLGLANAQDVRTLLTTFPGALFGTFVGDLKFAKSALSAAPGSITMKTATLMLEVVQ